MQLLLRIERWSVEHRKYVPHAERIVTVRWLHADGKTFYADGKQTARSAAGRLCRYTLLPLPAKETA